MQARGCLGPLAIQASGPNSRYSLAGASAACLGPALTPTAPGPAPSQLHSLPAGVTEGARLLSGPAQSCPLIPSHSPPTRAPLAPVTAHGPTCCFPFKGQACFQGQGGCSVNITREPVTEPVTAGPGFQWCSVIYHPCVTGVWTSMLTGPHRARCWAPPGPQPRAEGRCPEEP